MSKRDKKQPASVEAADGLEPDVPEGQALDEEESDVSAGDDELTPNGPELTLVDETAEDASADDDLAAVEDDAIQSTGVDSTADNDGTPDAGDDETPSADVENTPSVEGTLADGESIHTEQVVEALLFASDNPLTLPKIVSILGVGSAREVRKLIAALNERYEQQGTAFRIVGIAGGYQMMTLPVFNTWIRRLKQSRQESRLSPAAMETLAVVAYKQPVVRAEIEAIRGVSAGEMLNRLRELGLVKIVGRAEDVGRPMLYGTTKRFLEVFGLSGLEDLPEVEEFGPPPA